MVETLVADITKHGFHVTTGIIGTRAIYEALAKNGRMDVALKLLSKTDFPSYGFMVENVDEPATTLWEKWGASQLPTDQADSSRNHVSAGRLDRRRRSGRAGAPLPG